MCTIRDICITGMMKKRHLCGRRMVLKICSHTVEHELTFFVYNEDIDGYQQIQEIHTERTYDIETYQRLLKKQDSKIFRFRRLW